MQVHLEQKTYVVTIELYCSVNIIFFNISIITFICKYEGWSKSFEPDTVNNSI